MKLLAFLIVCALFAAGGFYVLDRHVPDRLNPFEPLAIADEPTFLTGMKLMRLRVNADECRAVLDQSELDVEFLPDRETGENCGFENVAQLRRSSISYGGDITLTCPALVALAVWEEHDLKPAAQEILGREIIRIRHYGTYACRNVNNRASGRRSEHAYANAIDIAGFVLEDSTEISVLDDWGDDNEEGRFLDTVHERACERFAVVLGPDYNNAHANHFHLDMGPFMTCR